MSLAGGSAKVSVLAKYFFNLGAPRLIVDEEGVCLPDLWSAQLRSVRQCADMLQAHPEWCWEEDAWRMEVCDRVGLILFSLNILPIAGAVVPRVSVP